MNCENYYARTHKTLRRHCMYLGGIRYNRYIPLTPSIKELL